MSSSGQNPPRASHLTWNKNQSLYNLALLLLLRTHLLIFHPFFTLVQLYQPLCCSLNMYSIFYEPLHLLLSNHPLAPSSLGLCANVLFSVRLLSATLFILLLTSTSYLHTHPLEFSCLIFFIVCGMGRAVSLKRICLSLNLRYL